MRVLVEPLLGAIRTGANTQGVASSPAKVEAKPEVTSDMPPDPYEIRVHPQLGLVSYQTLRLNYEHQVRIGAQEPYGPESLLIHWNTLTGLWKNPR